MERLRHSFTQHLSVPAVTSSQTPSGQGEEPRQQDERERLNMFLGSRAVRQRVNGPISKTVNQSLRQPDSQSDSVQRFSLSVSRFFSESVNQLFSPSES